jgi:hypothetical protein
MPLLQGKENIGHNISEMIKAGHPRAQSIAAAYHAAGEGAKDEDYKSLLEQMIKALQDEEDEANEQELAASDAALVRPLLALDRDSVREFDKEGRLHIATANICKACVSPYKGSEIPGWENLNLDPGRVYQMYRPPDVLKTATPTINGIQILRKHTPVNSEDHMPWDVVGAVGTTAKFVDPFIQNGLTIWSADDIEEIKSGKKRELSPGYFYVPVMEAGTTPDGENFDGKMTAIEFNHLAIVSAGRQPGILIGDSAEEIQWGTLEVALLGLSHP